MKTFTMDELQIQAEANRIKDLVIKALASEGLLKGTPAEIGSDFVVTIRSKGVFGGFFDKFFPIPEDRVQYEILKSIKKNKSYNKFLKIVKKQQEEDEKNEETSKYPKD